MLPQRKEFIRNILILSILTFIAFLPCVWNGFLTWDDPDYLTKNVMIKTLSLGNVIKLFSGFTAGSYMPLALLSYALEFKFVQLAPFLYHLDNILLHVIVTILVYRLILAVDGRPQIALLTALFFAVNPLRVESVAWISGRKDLLCAIFYISALLMHIKAASSTQKNYFWASFFLFACALLAKSQALSLPLALLAFDYFLKNKIEIDDVIKKIPFFILMVVFIFISLHGPSGTFPQFPLPTFSLLEKFLVTNFAAFVYIFLSAFPVKTSFFYPCPEKVNTFFPAYIYLSVFFNAFILYSFIKFAQKNKFILLAGSLLIITLLSPLWSIWHEGYFVSERDMYLPSIWLFYGIVRLWDEIKSKITVPASYATIAVAILIGFFALLSFGKCFIWKNDLSLWGNVIDTFPNSPAGYTIRGERLQELGWTDLAIKDMDQAIVLKTDDARTRYNRALLYMDKNQYALAITDLNQVLSLDLKNASARLYRALCNKEIRNYRQAMEDLAFLANNPETDNQTVEDAITELKTSLNQLK